MLKISDAVRSIIDGNSFLQFGISQKLLNLTRVSQFIQPLVEVRTKKEIQSSALLMNLSRIQKEYTNKVPQMNEYTIDHIVVHSNLALFTFAYSDEASEYLTNLYNHIHGERDYITLTRGTHEIMIIIDAKYIPLVDKLLVKPKFEKRNMSAVGVTFDEKYVHVPGFLYHVLQQTTLQNINVIEISSTFTEIVLYVEEKDTKLTFDTLYQSFSTSQ